MEATYRALCEHGYAALTMQDIADELDKSKSLLHYHFDTKEDLLVAFIEFLLEEFEEKRAENAEAPPEKRLEEFVDWFVFAPEEDDRTAFHIALLELRSQAPYTEAYREQLARSDRLVRETIVEIVEAGIESGEFRSDVDPESIARLVFATMDGARIRQATLAEAGYAAAVRDALYEYVLDDIVSAE
ncbi:MAG: TetR family transcriptional regulator [Euryarchaeota archaeon]|nr:TetR family transcriptional regulator [Euryarchaeota archaeon]